jgi:uncharacterized membrane protein YqjE
MPISFFVVSLTRFVVWKIIEKYRVAVSVKFVVVSDTIATLTTKSEKF